MGARSWLDLAEFAGNLFGIGHAGVVKGVGGGRVVMVLEVPGLAVAFAEAQLDGQQPAGLHDEVKILEQAVADVLHGDMLQDNEWT